VVVEGSTEAMASFLEQNTGLSGPIATSSAGLGGIIATWVDLRRQLRLRLGTLDRW
jgi:hypothetical protein